MGGFNPINLIINTMLINASNYAQSQSQGVNSGANSVNNGVLNQTNFSPLNYSNAQNQTTIYDSLTSAKQQIISTVEVNERANYIKDLLSLPRDFETLINQIQGNNDPNLQALKDLAKLLQGGKINLSALQSLLSENQKSAVQKLMMTIMTVSKMGSENVRQLKELVNLFQNPTAQDSSQMVKNIIMLYLPWLPLSIRGDMNLDFRIDIFDKIQGEDPNSEESEMIKILIQTANYGNILATLETSLNGDIDIFISANEDFPEKEVLSKLKEEKNINTNLSVEKIKEANQELGQKQEIQITASDFVSPKLLLAAHTLIKIIIELDFSNFIINEEEE